MIILFFICILSRHSGLPYALSIKILKPMKKILSFLSAVLTASSLTAQNIPPLVYQTENSGVSLENGMSPAPNRLTYDNEALPDPFEYFNGGYDCSFGGWEKHRMETARMVQDYEIGIRPDFEKVTAAFDKQSQTISVKVTAKNGVLEFSSKIVMPPTD